jgi:putative Mn2+ efflux pump MntP
LIARVYFTPEIVRWNLIVTSLATSILSDIVTVVALFTSVKNAITAFTLTGRATAITVCLITIIALLVEGLIDSTITTTR